MHASPSPSSTDAPARRQPGRPPDAGEEGVTEVLGAIISFAIVTVVFVLSMLAFERAQTTTEDRILQLRADSAASRVSALLVHAATFEETHGSTIRARYVVDLPADLEGRAYEVALVVPATGKASVEVRVPSRGITGAAPLLSIEASAICLEPTTVGGGGVAVRYGPSPSDPSTDCLFLEAAA